MSLPEVVPVSVTNDKGYEYISWFVMITSIISLMKLTKMLLLTCPSCEI